MTDTFSGAKPTQISLSFSLSDVRVSSKVAGDILDYNGLHIL